LDKIKKSSTKHGIMKKIKNPASNLGRGAFTGSHDAWRKGHGVGLSVAHRKHGTPLYLFTSLPLYLF
jgi:hypothetical protein